MTTAGVVVLFITIADLIKYLYPHSFYYVDIFLMCKEDLSYGFCQIFLVFCTLNLYISIVMTCPASCCLYDSLMDSWNVYMYVGIH